MNHRTGIPVILAMTALLFTAASRAVRAQGAGEGSHPTISTISDEEIEALMKGSGNGAGRPAEVNGYPGPNRMVEHAAELGLTADQVAKVKSLTQKMKKEAVEIGKRIVEDETKLDALLKSGSVDRSALSSLVSEIAGLRGRMRLVHLELHFALRELLTAEQLLRYRALGADEGRK